MGFLIFIIIIGILALLIAASCIKIVPQAYAIVLERLGAYKTTWNTGIHFKMPFIERVARKVNLKEQVVDFPPQPVITKDNVTMQIDTVVFFQITDPKLFAYGAVSYTHLGSQHKWIVYFYTADFPPHFHRSDSVIHRIPQKLSAVCGFLF